MSNLVAKKARRTLPLSSDWDPIEEARCRKPASLPARSPVVFHHQGIARSRARVFDARILRTLQRGVVVLSLARPVEICGDNARAFFDALCERSEKDRLVVLDAIEVRHIENEGMDALLDVRERLVRRGGGFALARPRSLVAEVLHLAGLDCQLKIYPSVPLAVDRLLLESEGTIIWS